MLTANELSHFNPEPLVLIVEDDLTTEPLWSYMIGQTEPSSRLLWATSETAAEKILQRQSQRGHPVSLVVADIFLQGTGNGLDLWRRHAMGQTPFVMMSVMNADRVGKLIGPDEFPPIFIKKPLNPIQCMEVLRHFLRNFP